MYRQFGTHDFTWYKSHVIPILLTILPRSINFSITSSKNLLQVFTSLCLRFFCRSPRLSISLSLLNHPPTTPQQHLCYLLSATLGKLEMGRSCTFPRQPRWHPVGSRLYCLPCPPCVNFCCQNLWVLCNVHTS